MRARRASEKTVEGVLPRLFPGGGLSLQSTLPPAGCVLAALCAASSPLAMALRLVRPSPRGLRGLGTGLA